MAARCDRIRISSLAASVWTHCPFIHWHDWPMVHVPSVRRWLQRTRQAPPSHSHSGAPPCVYQVLCAHASALPWLWHSISYSFFMGMHVFWYHTQSSSQVAAPVRCGTVPASRRTRGRRRSEARLLRRRRVAAAVVVVVVVSGRTAASAATATTATARPPAVT